MAEGARDFSWREGLAFCLAWIGIQLCSETFNQWGLYFYSPPEDSARSLYVPLGLVTTMFIVATCWDAISSPLVGAWSDRTSGTSRLFRALRISGRRRPFIFWGSLLMTVTFIGAWYPPVQGASIWNFVYGTAFLCGHWFVFSVTTVPILALAPEVATTAESRMQLGIWVAVGSIVGLAIANALSGELILLLDPSPIRVEVSVAAAAAAETAGTTQPGGELVVEPTYAASAEGYRRLAMVYALLSLLFFQFLVWAVRERYSGAARSDSWRSMAGELGEVVRNRPFVVYFVSFFFFTTGLLASQRVIPYWAEVGLGGNEATVTLLLAPYIVACLLTYPFVPMLTRRLGIKWTVFLSLLILATSLPWMYPIAASDSGAGVKTSYGALLFAYAGIGQGIMYVMMTPLIGEIIDYDAARSGERREALYNGLSTVAWKASMAGSILIATQSMRIWGNSVEAPLGIYLVGPIAGFCGLLGCGVMALYPRDASAAPATTETGKTR